ncbi:hypothetical protein [Cellvibrio mixtus]|uniref:hypothetical protein n=1 Tax=Cellvibrio mixtus TaxID=39650 RepID=UPI00126A17F2|nr:hypothetical protein [Cellvibrio mixtus]
MKPFTHCKGSEDQRAIHIIWSEYYELRQERHGGKTVRERSSQAAFGNRTQEENEALERIKTLGSPENLIKPGSDDEPCSSAPQKSAPK